MLSWCPKRDFFVSCFFFLFFEMKNIIITDIYWVNIAGTLHFHGIYIRCRCHYFFMCVNKLSVCGGWGSHLRLHITKGEARMQESLFSLKACHFGGRATRRWLSLGSNDFIFYHFPLRQTTAAGWEEPC